MEGLLRLKRGLRNGICSTKCMNKVNPFGIIFNNSLQNRTFCSESSRLPVLIVGAGPVGLVLSILLTKLGVKCSVLEKNLEFSNHPQAHFINNRSMEIFRKMDGLAEEIERSQPPVDCWRKFVYCTSLTGPILGSVDHMQPQDFEKVVSPVSVAHFSQYKLVRLLLKKLEELKFHVLKSDSVECVENWPLEGKELLMGHECVSIRTTNQSVSVTALRRRDGTSTERHINCDILVATDGSGSTVRTLAGIEMEGEKDLQKLVSVHFLSKDLGEYLLKERPGMLFFIFNTDAIGVLVAHDLMQGEFILQMPFYPPQQKMEDFSPEICKKLIFKLVGQELLDIEVIDIKPWVMHAEVAERFVTCDNRVILAGDAAHRFPPAGGFGMNTGIQDAHNLAWKIASHINGSAPSSLLHTYETERRPVAVYNTALSVQNFRAAMSIPTVLGIDPTIANSVHRAITNTIGSVLPSSLQRAILEGIFTIGRAQLSQLVLNEQNPIGSLRLAKLKRIFEEGKSLQLQFPAEDLGFRYLEGALVPGGVHAPEPPTGHRRDYVPCSDPGSRLPHMEVRILSEKAMVSTLNLVSVDKVEFLLIVAPVEQSYQLARATFKAAQDFRVAVRVCILWSDANVVNGIKANSEPALTPWKNYIDVAEVKRQSNSPSWWSMCQMTERGAMLVRPDEHIAWLTESGINRDPVSEMKRVFSAVLGLK